MQRKLFGLILELLILGAIGGMISAEPPSDNSTKGIYSKPYQISPQRITPGTTIEYWVVESIKLYTINHGPWQIAGINHCNSSDASCSVGKTIQYCSSVSVSGSIKVGIEILEEQLGVTIGSTYCDSTTCSVSCPGGKTAVIEWRYAKPVKKIIQRKYTVYPDGHTEKGGTTTAYVTMNPTVECNSYCQGG